ncbi:MAG: hypothetical protein JWP01_3624 [Myxococcales bacterium]|nr:hypothetical protein [Myxococcales bacterium]
MHPQRTLALLVLMACRGAEPEGAEPPVSTSNDRVRPAFALWTFEGKTGPCLWREIALGAPMRELARFPVACEEADLAWSGPKAIAWLRAPKDHLFAVTLGEAPVALPPPPYGVLLAVGFDDVPLVFTTPTRSDARNVTSWALVDGAWRLRDDELKPLRELASWQSQRGGSARKVRELANLKPFQPGPGTLEDLRSRDRVLDDIERSLDATLATPAGKRSVERGNAVTVTAAPTSWWTFGVGARGDVPILIRRRDDRLVPDMRRFVDGRWESLPGPQVEVSRREAYRAGVEIRDTLLLISSDGRGPVLVDATTGSLEWGNRELALALFAPDR